MKKDKVMFIVDFGLAKEYIDPDTNKHIPYRCNIFYDLLTEEISLISTMNLKLVSGSTSH